MLSLNQKLAKNYINSVGWKTKRKLLLIESDDWGAIRMPSNSSYERFLKAKIPVNDLHIDKFDSVESESDLSHLLELLSNFEDISGNPAVLTAYSLVANPDFEKIQLGNREEYHFELITKLYERNEHTKNSYSLINEGIERRLFYPQFHGREHINVSRWMKAITSNSVKENIAFNERAIISTNFPGDINQFGKSYFAAFDYSSDNEVIEINNILVDGLSIFKQLFGYDSISFTAQGSIWGDSILSTLAENGVKLIGGQQLVPDLKAGYRTKNKIWGSQNKFGQIHWRRNCTFEPARDQDYDWVNRCLQEIKIAFRWGKPAVISSHRENYIGSIFPENRDQSLKKLRILLKEVQKRWPDVEFIDTERLAHIMIESIEK